MQFSKRLAIDVLNVALSTGGDYAEIYYQDKTSHKYVRRYRRVENISSTNIRGVGIRIIKGTQQSYASTSDLSRKNLLSLAESLSFAFEGERKLSVSSLKEKKFKKISPIKKAHDSMSDEEKVNYLKRGEDAAFNYSDKVKDFSGSLLEQDEHVEVFNSEGIYYQDDRVRTRIAALVIAEENGNFQSDFEGPGYTKGLELLDEIDYVEMVKKVAKNACDLLNAKESPSGEMPVIIGNGFGGVLFHEACGHPLEGSAISDKLSPFADKYGEAIASSVVTAIDDGTIANAWGSESVDDEGHEPTKNVLIKDGVLTSYMLDRFTANKMGENFHPTGACRRESYAYTPTTRMTNTYIANGTSKVEDIIASVKDGIYCTSFTGGQVDPSTDQFIFTSSLTYKIKNGKITELVKPVSLVGYGYDILKKITMVADDLALGPGICGASSGSVCVCVGQPTLLISSILVGGAGGNK